jgi:DNA-binding MarR family transcriptional regulator
MEGALQNPKHNSAGGWAKKFHLASRAVMDATLRPYDLGSTQWYVLWHLANEGPQAQRDLLGKLNIEKPTLSGVISALVRKGFVQQTADPRDKRQRLLTITTAGSELWAQLPDLIALIRTTAFHGVPDDDLAAAVRVLSTATKQLQDHLNKGDET